MRGQERIGFDSPIQILDEAERTGQLLGLEQMVTSRALAKFATLGNCQYRNSLPQSRCPADSAGRSAGRRFAATYEEGRHRAVLRLL